MTLNNLSHVAFILDGNKRWAKKNNLSSAEGYQKGFDNIKNISNFFLKEKINYLTLFTLSSENFLRPSIKVIYEIIYRNFNNLIEDYISKKNIKINIFGSRKNLPNKIINIFEQAEKLNKKNYNMQLNLAFNYGFKEEISDIINKISVKNYNKFNEKNIKNLFYLGSICDPDILIRTGGYKRLSNFIMYNLTYTELFFSDTLWPEFTINELKKILLEFSKIDRKYGL